MYRVLHKAALGGEVVLKKKTVHKLNVRIPRSLKKNSSRLQQRRLLSSSFFFLSIRILHATSISLSVSRDAPSAVLELKNKTPRASCVLCASLYMDHCTLCTILSFERIASLSCVSRQRSCILHFTLRKFIIYV